MKKIRPKIITDNLSKLFVYQFRKNFSLNLKRFFIVEGVKGQLRGKHAHKKSKKIIFCINGVCKIFLDNGKKKSSIILTDTTLGIEVPRLVWSEQLYIKKNTKILVLTDKDYNKDDYISDYKIFKKLIK